jgi:hypothetical protein
VDAPLELPFDPLYFLRETALRLTLRNGPKARKDTFAPMPLVDRAPAETIDRDPACACARHVIPPVVVDACPKLWC